LEKIKGKYVDRMDYEKDCWGSFIPIIESIQTALKSTG